MDSQGGKRKDFVSFDELVNSEAGADYDAGMAERVARRKVRRGSGSLLGRGIPRFQERRGRRLERFLLRGGKAGHPFLDPGS